MSTDIPNNLYRAARPLHAKVVENRLLSPAEPFERQARHIVLSFEDPFRYRPGQSVGVIPGQDPETGRPRKLRLFSIASTRKGDRGDGRTLSLCVVRHFWDDPQTGRTRIPGLASNYLCDLKEGDDVQVTGPVGRHFLLPEDSKKRDVIFVATGTGIAPYRGMLQEMVDAGYEGEAWLVFGSQTRDRLYYDAEFKAAAQKIRLHYLPAVSREETNPFPDRLPTRRNRMYVQVKMAQHAEALRRALTKPDTALYICGLKGMEQGILSLLNAWGREQGLEQPWSDILKQEKRLIMEVY